MNYFPADSYVVHFVGIGGIGMSGIADIMANLGYCVSGSDLKESMMTLKLIKKGIKVFIGHHDAEHVNGASVVVISSAVSQNNPEIVAARKLKIPVVMRAEMLAELMKMKQSIAIAGTHGKTTTTSLVAAILDQALMDPTVVNGGIINAYNSNARLGSGDWMVVEADESDGSFTKLMPTVAVITNIDFDHIDNFENFNQLKKMFASFISHIPFYGIGVLCLDHPVVAELCGDVCDRKLLTYGFAEDADVRCDKFEFLKTCVKFDVVFSQNMQHNYATFLFSTTRWNDIVLPMFGMHNIQNALASIGVALHLGISENNVKLALGSFMGVKRRFTKVGAVNGISVIDDYGHHPVEIESVLRAARNICSGKIHAVIQPHRYSRLKNFLNEFAKVAELADNVYITPVYSAGEEPLFVDHFDLINTINETNVICAEFTETVNDLFEQTIHKLQSGDYLIFLGAGDITKWAYEYFYMLYSHYENKQSGELCI